MRTTVTLDPDTEQLVRELMAERQVSFKQALNDAIRTGAVRRPRPERFETRTFDLGRSAITLDRALLLVGELEDEDLVRESRQQS